jgi:putative Holliday junction resolvase
MPESAAPPPVAASVGAAAVLVLAFDFGQRRIGVACGDSMSRTTTPLITVAARTESERWARVDTLMREWQPGVLVVGLPYNVDGSEGTATAAARRFASELAKRYSVPVQLVDERYSSLEAEARLKRARESGIRKRRVAKADVDAAAACIVLERWFSQET